MDDEIARAERARQGSPYLNTAQAAHFLGVSVRTLQRLRGSGKGPPPRRHARMVQYHIDDLVAWSWARTDPSDL
ncbi:MAG TPA: helix-turn-helix domain-containing protein [Sphingomonas sp.]|nr:helix-turn-helix domain-containing protein [Sphingomonas sp.]